MLRIGELAARTGLTAATIRYYEQIGLLPGGPRPRRSHRVYSEADVGRLNLLRRLRDLLGVSLEQLQEIAAAEEAAAALPARVGNAGSLADRLILVDEALRQADGVLDRVRPADGRSSSPARAGAGQHRRAIEAARITTD